MISVDVSVSLHDDDIARHDFIDRTGERACPILRQRVNDIALRNDADHLTARAQDHRRPNVYGRHLIANLLNSRIGTHRFDARTLMLQDSGNGHDRSLLLH